MSLNTATGASPPEETRVTPAQQQDVFTFVTVYYKHGEWNNSVFDTLREGLLAFVDSTASESEKKSLILLDDKELTDRLLVIGMHTVYFWPMYY
jgi:hypothetical protein